MVVPGASVSTRPRHSTWTGGTSRGSTLISAPLPLPKVQVVTTVVNRKPQRTK